MSAARRFLGLIPARGGSKGIPRKNLVSVAGKPLIGYTIEAALRSRHLDRVLLSTDDEEIAETGRRIGLKVPFLRPAELAADDTPMMAVIKHALREIAKTEGDQPTVVVLLQPTSPLRTEAHIDAAIELFEKEQADSVVSVSEPLEHPCDMVSFENGTMTLALSAEERWKGRQTYPKFYFVNGAIYIVKTELIGEARHPWGGKTVPFLMSPLESIDVDGHAQLTITELLLGLRQIRQGL
ncbi:MAG: acylneuraminate cytidylyltransferase family protein [Nitrospirae bacterium]|nr:MAG: acylneuraminate cytidylyltransferase family protein [Nitrospirota bacterium]